MPNSPKSVGGSFYRARPSYRPTAPERGYNERWKKLRKSFIESEVARGNICCGICGDVIDDTQEPVHVDHIVPPASVGVPGSREYERLFYSEENLQLAHARCNARKGNRVARPE